MVIGTELGVTLSGRGSINCECRGPPLSDTQGLPDQHQQQHWTIMSGPGRNWGDYLKTRVQIVTQCTKEISQNLTFMNSFYTAYYSPMTGVCLIWLGVQHPTPHNILTTSWYWDKISPPETLNPGYRKYKWSFNEAFLIRIKNILSAMTPDSERALIKSPCTKGMVNEINSQDFLVMCGHLFPQVCTQP